MIYIGANGKSKKLEKLYVGVDNLSRKVVKCYVGVNGKAKLFYASEITRDSLNPSDPTKMSFLLSGSVWEAAITGSITFRPSFSAVVSLFIVAGGQTGVGQRNGGMGGGRLTVANFALKSGVTYTVTIGASGEATTITGSDGTSYTAASGEGSGMNGDGVLAFSGGSILYPAVKFGAGGGQGDYLVLDQNGVGTLYEGNRTAGQTGGGSGSRVKFNDPVGSGWTSETGTAGQANTGSGGGGAVEWNNNGNVSFLHGTTGGSGILLIQGVA